MSYALYEAVKHLHQILKYPNALLLKVDLYGFTENAGHEFAINDKYRMKIYYITV